MQQSRLHRIKRKKSISGKKVLLLILIFVGFGLSVLILKALSFYRNIQTEIPGKKIVATKTPEQRNTYNVLLLGYGGGKHEGTYLTDTIMLLNIDLKQKKAIIISIPRDIWVKIPTKDPKEDFHYKINAVYQMGLFPKEFPGVDTTFTKDGNTTGLIKQVVTQMTGIPIDAYVSVDFDGFTSAIDILGGLDITVDRSFSDYEYPLEGKENELCGKEEDFKKIEKFLTPGFDEEEKKKLFEEKPELEKFFKDITEDPVIAFPCRYETLKFEKGLTHMDGKTALKYARSRHSLDDGGDFNRAVRQQKVLEAIKEKTLNLGVITKIFPLMDDLENYIETDMPQNDIQRFLPQITNIDDYTQIHFVITEPEYVKSSYSEYGQYILIPNNGIDKWNKIKTELRNIMLGITPTPTRPPITPTRRPTTR